MTSAALMSHATMQRNKDQLAKQLRQNWATRFPHECSYGAAVDANDDLTNLGWLQNSNLMNASINCSKEDYNSSIFPPIFASSSQHLSYKPVGESPLQMTDVTSSTSNIFLDKDKCLEVYRTNHHQKPPYSHATLLCKCMRALNKSKLSLAEICAWIMENFAYYRHAEPSWQNHLLHSLSMNKHFQKVPRRKEERGKSDGSCFWRVKPEYQHQFINTSMLPINACQEDLLTKRKHVLDYKQTDGFTNDGEHCCKQLVLPSMHTVSKWLIHKKGVRGDSSRLLAVDKITTESELVSSTAQAKDESSPRRSSKERCIFNNTEEADLEKKLSPSLGPDCLTLDLTVHGQSLCKPLWWNRAAPALQREHAFKMLQSPSPLVFEDGEWFDSQLEFEGLDSYLGIDITSAS